MDDKYRDWIPEGEDAGALAGKAGFQDFVPAPEPKHQVITEVVAEPLIETPQPQPQPQQPQYVIEDAVTVPPLTQPEARG